MQTKRTFLFATGAAAALVLAGAGAIMFSAPASATMLFAKQTGKSCADCHTDAKGGGALTPFGEKFKANGNKLPTSP